MDNAGDSIPVTIDKDNSDDAINLNQDSVEKETPQNAEVQASDNCCIIPECQYDTLECGMFNHLVYHQKPHHSLSHSTAREIHQGWLDAQKVVNENESANTDDITKKSDSNIDDGKNTDDSVKIEIHDGNEGKEINNVVRSTGSTLSKIKQILNPFNWFQAKSAINEEKGIELQEKEDENVSNSKGTPVNVNAVIEAEKCNSSSDIENDNTDWFQSNSGTKEEKEIELQGKEDENSSNNKGTPVNLNTVVEAEKGNSSSEIENDNKDNDCTTPKLLRWCKDNQESTLHCDEIGTVTHLGGDRQLCSIRTSSSISSNVDIFYFECEVTQYKEEHFVGIGFTISGLTEKNPSDNTYDMAMAMGCMGLWLRDDDVKTVQYGKLTLIENIDQIKDGDIIGVVLKRVLITGKKYSVVELCVNGIKIGHPLLSDTFTESAYPTIWMAEPGYSMTTNLGSKPFQYDTILASDTNVNQAYLFQWRPSKADGPMKIEDACITYEPEQEGDDTKEDEEEEEEVVVEEGDITEEQQEEDEDDTEEEEEEEWKLVRKGRILGSNPIPRSMGEYSFTITCLTPNQDFAVGFTSEHRSVVYEGRVGVISKEAFIAWELPQNYKNYYHKKQISSVEKTNINDTIECRLLYQTVGEGKYAIVQFIKNSQIISSQALETDLVWPVIQIGSSQTKIDTNPDSQDSESQEKSEKTGSLARCSCPKCPTISCETARRLLMSFWRLVFLFTSWFTIPLLAVTDQIALTKDVQHLWAPKDPKMLLMAYLFNYLLPITDVASDLFAGIFYHLAGDEWFSRITLMVMFLPFLVKLLQESVEMYKFYHEDPKVFKHHWKAILKIRLKNVFKHIPFFQPIVNLRKLVKLSQMVEGTLEAEKTMIQLQENSNLEPFLESAPQMGLQMYIWMTTGKTSFAMTWSIVSSALSVGMASGATFLLERVLHPVGVVNIGTKLFLAMLFVLVSLPRLMTVALLTSFSKTWSCDVPFDKIFLLAFFALLLLLLFITVQRGTTTTLPKRPVWNHSLGSEYYDIKGEYELRDQQGFDEHISELKRKSMFISIFCPSITLFQESRLFEITSILSTTYYIITLSAGWAFSRAIGELKIPNISSMNSTTSTATVPPTDETLNTTYSGIFINCTLATISDTQIFEITDILFPVCFALLIVSVGSQVLLWHLSDHINLYRLTRGLFSHPSLIAITVDKLAANEYEMERKAKEQKQRNWRDELQILYTKEDLRMRDKESVWKLLQDLSEVKIQLSTSVVVSKKGDKKKISRRIDELLFTLRYSEDHICYFIGDASSASITNKEERSCDANISQNGNTPMITEDGATNQIPIPIPSCDCGCDDVDDEGNTRLLNALKEKDLSLATTLLLKGASVIHRNRKGETAFPLACSVTNDPTIKYLIWHFVKEENAENSTFFKSCQSNNIDSVKYCLDGVKNDTQKEKRMLEWIGRGHWYCGLFEAMSQDHKEIVDLLFPLYEKNYSDVLKKKGKNGSNPLMCAAREGSASFGNTNIVQKLIPLYKEKKLLGELDGEGMNALMTAAYWGALEVLNILLPHFEEENLIHNLSEDGENVLDIARQKGNVKIVVRLMPFFKEDDKNDSNTDLE